MVFDDFLELETTFFQKVQKIFTNIKDNLLEDPEKQF